jgi:limonene 1,2-monooxygenase
VPLAEGGNGEVSDTEYIEQYAASGRAMIGTPDDAIAYVQELLDQSGGFGTFLQLGHDWASPRRPSSPTGCSPGT